MKVLKFLWIPVVAIILLVVVLNGYIYFNQDNLIFAKEKINPNKVRPYGSHFEDVYLDMEDGSRFKCWFVKAEDHENKPVFLYYLGKGGYVEKYVKLFDMIVQRVDVSIFSCSNRGCGTNKGNPSEEQLYKDALVPLNYLKQKNTKQLFIFGNSMGGAVALETASKHQKDLYGLILENPFLSVKDMSEQNYPFLNFFLLSFDVLIRTKMDNKEKIKKIHVPLLINTSELPTPVLCENNCGFYGNPANNNLCSKCYREFQEKKKKEISDVEKMNEKNISENLHNYKKINSLMEPSYISDKQMEAEKPTFMQNEKPLPEEQQPASTNININSVETDNSENNGSNQNESGSSSNNAAPEGTYEQSTSTNVNEAEDKKKCFFCCKRIGLLGIKCRCNHYFCSLHRYADAHNCTFDYKNYHKQQLIKNNVKVVADKVKKI